MNAMEVSKKKIEKNSIDFRRYNDEKNE